MKCPQCNSDIVEDSKFCKECGTQVTPVDDAQPSFTKTLETPVGDLTRGTLFADRYEIIEELGRGGMGSVYRVEDTKLHEEVALKLIKPEISYDRKTIDRFSNELKLARKIVHKNIGRMFELMEDKGTHFITMEYVPGQDLKGLIRQSAPISIARTISIAKQICAGLAEAHSLGVIHRDLKPSNIMIDKAGNARIMDFGIAQSLETKGMTGAGVMIGTPEYMSPEQVEGKETDQRSDVYSLGVILYEMLTGNLPFKGDTAFAVAFKQKSEIPTSPSSLNPQIPPELNLIVMRCLEKRRESRFQSSLDLIDALTLIEQEIPTSLPEISTKKPLTSKSVTVTFNLRRLAFLILFFVALIAAFLFIWKPWSNKKAIPSISDKPVIAVVPFTDNSGDENLQYLKKAIPLLIRSDLSQSQFLYVVLEDRILQAFKELDLLSATSFASEDLKGICSETRANYVLTGNYTSAGETIIITALVQDPFSDQVPKSIKKSCAGPIELEKLVDELSREVKSALKLTDIQITQDVDRGISEITTRSPEALKLYIQGRSVYETDGEKSIEFMKRALDYDPEFAMAYRSISAAHSRVGNTVEAKENMQKAFERSEPLTPIEKYLIHGGYYFLSEETYGESIEAYQRMLEYFPEGSRAHNNLGNVYKYLEDWDKAADQFVQVIENGDKSRFPYCNMSEIWNARGDYIKAREILYDYRDNIEDSWPVYWYLANISTCEAKYDLALKELDKALNKEPGEERIYRQIGMVLSLKGDFQKAEEQLSIVRESAERGARYSMALLRLAQGRFIESQAELISCIEVVREAGMNEAAYVYYRAYNFWRRGDFDTALEEIKKVLSLSAGIEQNVTLKVRALLLKGLVRLDMGDSLGAAETVGMIQEAVENWLNPKIMRNYHLLSGMIELENQNYPEAIEQLDRGISLLSHQKIYLLRMTFVDDHALYYDALAQAYYESGNLSEAIRVYKDITNLTTGRMLYGDIYAKSFYMLGRIYEQQGETTKAIEHYDKFLTLWKDSDPGQAEVQDARERVTELRRTLYNS